MGVGSVGGEWPAWGEMRGPRERREAAKGAGFPSRAQQSIDQKGRREEDSGSKIQGRGQAALEARAEGDLPHAVAALDPARRLGVAQAVPHLRSWQVCLFVFSWLFIRWFLAYYRRLGVAQAVPHLGG